MPEKDAFAAGMQKGESSRRLQKKRTGRLLKKAACPFLSEYISFTTQACG